MAPRIERPALPGPETNEPVTLSVESPAAAWPDEAVESAMVSELRARGETAAPLPSTALVEETEGGTLPPLNELVQKIPAEVREVLDDLFRARFVTVKRVPKKALKQA